MSAVQTQTAPRTTARIAAALAEFVDDRPIGMQVEEALDPQGVDLSHNGYARDVAAAWGHPYPENWIG
ncbi:MAG: hypothetical protein Greene041619_585 [Candidatus Peregrinibacteria bacterium Greene0416_19]|nr:MAG: hypothetical protein Greene041619_585 [Candidatus Peregrinibacteria bacterium Greene0416_19]